VGGEILILTFIDHEKAEELDYKFGGRLPWVQHFKEEYGIDVRPTTDYSCYFAKGRNGTYKLLPYAVALDILRDLPTVYCEGLGLLVYQDGVYYSGKEMLLQQKIQEFLNFEATNNRVSEVIGHITRKKVLPPEAFNKVELLNVKNGLLNIETGELYDHTPDIYTTIQIPVIYDPDAECPHINKFFRDIVVDDTVPILEEWFGYCMFPNTSFGKSVMLTGGGGNGKSVLIKLFNRFIGNYNVAHNDLQDFEKNRFATANLFGKLANTSADLPANALKDTGVFKKIVTGDELQAEYKGKDSFKFVPFAKLMFSANELPTSTDVTDGFFRRWIIINFPYTFKGKDADPNLIDKLTTQEELSGLLNLSLKAYKHLRKQGHFSENVDTINALNEYKRANDKVIQFIEEECVKNDQAKVQKRKLYLAYQDWCHLSGYKALGQHKFYKSIELKGFCPNKARVNGQRAFSGIGISMQSDYRIFK
jgi:putative DNA primase/helicase